MKIKKVMIILVTILAILGGGILNFREFINDYWPVNIKNVIVTTIYIVTWIIVLSISIKYKYFRITKVYTVFWFMTLLHALLLIYSNVTGANLGWAILSSILFLCPWYGFTYFIKDSMNIGILIATCSLFILAINHFYIFSNSKHKHKLI